MIVDDEPIVVDVLRELLGRRGHDVQAVRDAAACRGAIESGREWDVVLLDLMLPDADGIAVLRWIHTQSPDLAVVMITAHGTIENAVAAMQAGAFHYLSKPFKNDEVRSLVDKAVEATRLRRENETLRRELDERHRYERLIGKSRAMQEVYRFVDQVAQSRATVLIQGESGTGKELVAHAIHHRSPRAARPLVVVNSNSIPADLLEDNLFGHLRGAFTGANTSRIGLMESAEGGTLLFDEITTVAPAVQAKLLRVIQEKEFIPLGSVEAKVVDVRILAATNEDVRGLVADGRFREDLYYRLNVLSVELPPLRKRPEDLPLLIEHFLRRYNAENRKQVERVAPAVMERLLGHSWPGNVRELENVIERGVVLARGSEIGLESLPPELVEAGFAPPRGVALSAGASLSDAVARFERALIVEALKRSEGVQKEAAAMLGMKPTTLHEKMKRLGIHR